MKVRSSEFGVRLISDVTIDHNHLNRPVLNVSDPFVKTILTSATQRYTNHLP